MNPTDLYLNQPSWGDHLLNGNSTASGSTLTSQAAQTPVSNQPAHYVQQSTTNFAGSTVPTTSSATHYTSVPNVSQNGNPYFTISPNTSGATNGHGAGASGTITPSTFYSQQALYPYYYQNTTAIPISAYSSLSGATTVPQSVQPQQSSTSSAATQQSVTPGQLQQLQHQQQQQRLQQQQLQQQSQQQQTLNAQQGTAQSQQQNSATQPLTIDPALMGMNASPYMYYRPQYPPGAQGSTATNMFHGGYLMPTPAHQHQHMQTPQVITTPQSSRSPHGYSNTLASRSPSVQVQSPPVVNANATASSSSVQPGMGHGFPATYKDILTARTLDKAPETTANSIISLLSKSSWMDIDLPTRLDILTKIRDNAGKDFYKVWAKSSAGMEVLKDWLKTTVTMKGWDETLMPLLFIIDRLPFDPDIISSTRIGKVLIKVVKEAPNAAAKDLATNIEKKWRSLIARSQAQDEQEDARSKKRKFEAQSSKGAPPLKKPSVTSGVKPASTTIVKKVVQPAKDSKVDSSFFSSKPKPKLPSFRKITAPQTTTVKKEEPDSAVAQPSSIDPFQEAMKLMGKSTPPPGMDNLANGVASASLNISATSFVEMSLLGKNGKPKKRVTFPTDEKLVLIKYIERAIYDDDEHGEETHHSSYRDLDIDEGHALHATMFEEQLDYYEPLPIELPEEVMEKIPRGADSTESSAQEEREKAALMAVYMSPAHIPDTPSDLYPGMDAVPDETETVMMLPGVEVAGLEVAPPAVPASLQDLLAKISGNTASQQAPAFGAAGFGDGPYSTFGSQPQESEVSWGAGSGGGASDMYGGGAGYGGGNSGSQGGWTGQGSNPAAGAHYGDEWENSGGPPPSRWNQRPRQQQGKSNIPPGIKINSPCKFYNGPYGQVIIHFLLSL